MSFKVGTFSVHKVGEYGDSLMNTANTPLVADIKGLGGTTHSAKKADRLLPYACEVQYASQKVKHEAGKDEERSPAIGVKLHFQGLYSNAKAPPKEFGGFLVFNSYNERKLQGPMTIKTKEKVNDKDVITTITLDGVINADGYSFQGNQHGSESSFCLYAEKVKVEVSDKKGPIPKGTVTWDNKAPNYKNA